MIFVLLFFTLFHCANILSSDKYVLEEDDIKNGWTQEILEENRVNTKEETEKNYELLSSKQKDGFRYNCSSGIDSYAFVDFKYYNENDSEKKVTLKLGLFYPYQDDKKEKTRLYVCDILNKIDCYIKMAQNTDLNKIEDEELFIQRAKEQKIFGKISEKMEIVDLLKNPDCISILNLANGQYWLLNETDMVTNYNPDNGELGWIELCEKCSMDNKCRMCKFTSTSCADRSGLSHFCIKYPLKLDINFDDLIDDSSSGSKEGNKFFLSWPIIKSTIALLVVTGIPFAWWLRNKKHKTGQKK